MSICCAYTFVHISDDFPQRNNSDLKLTRLFAFQKYHTQVLLFSAVCEDVRCPPAPFTSINYYEEKETLLIWWAKRVLILILDCMSFMVKEILWCLLASRISSFLNCLFLFDHPPFCRCSFLSDFLSRDMSFPNEQQKQELKSKQALDWISMGSVVPCRKDVL